MSGHGEHAVDDRLLEVKDLTISFPTEAGVIRAVNEVSFEVPRRTTVGVVGESGCGKSVTARALLNIVQPPGRIDGGQVLFHDDAAGEPLDLLSMAPKGASIRHFRGKRIAMIFQDPMTCLSPVHTVGNQIAESIRIHDRGVSTRDARERAIALLTEVGIPNPAGHLDSYSFELSGGMRQRALMAVALAAEPELLIADEPTTAIDVTIQAKVLGLLKELQAQTGMAILFITHNLGVIAELADRVNVMYLGRIVESGSVYDLFDDPRHPYSQKLLQSIPSIAVEPGSELQTIEGSLPDPYLRLRGCRFAERCGEFMADVCDGAEPELVAVGSGHHARCYLYDRPAAGAAKEQADARSG